MADSSPPPTPPVTLRDDIRLRSTRGSPTGTPRWVKVFMLIAIVLVLLFVILHLTGNGFGSSMHMSAIEPGMHLR